MTLPNFDVWLYVWAVRGTGSVFAPVHDLHKLWPAWCQRATRAYLGR